MGKSSRRIEFLVNLGIIVVALVFCGILIRRYFGATPEKTAAAQPDPHVPIGTKISLSDSAWPGEKRLLLALSTKCHYCSESAPFYRQLVNEVAKQRNVHLIAVLPEKLSEDEEYLKNLGVTVSDVRQMTLQQIDVMATPTLILVDNSGTVIKSWLGKLTAEEESEVLSFLRGSDAEQAEHTDGQLSSIEAVDLEKMIGKGRQVTIIDVRERSEYRQRHIAGALNIPLDELSVRAANELKESDFIVVYADCAHCANDEKGLAARKTLNDLGFHRTFVLSGESRIGQKRIYPLPAAKGSAKKRQSPALKALK